MKSTRLANLCMALGLISFLIYNSQAAITVDGTKDADYGTALSVQTVTSGWGEGSGNNTLASLSAVQQGSSLYVFLAGRGQGSAFMLFIDSKPGGITFIPNNLISGGGEEWCINNFGTSASAGMTFEAGFQPDYAVRVYGDDGGGTGGWAAVYPLTAGASRTYIGDSGSVGGASGSIVTLLKSSWQNVTGNYADATQGSEIQLNLAQLGVPVGTAQPVKFMVMLVNGGSDYGSNQVLGSLPAGSGDLAGNMKTTDFNAVAGTQTISTTVDNLDADGDGIGDATDPDDDNDGLNDTVETNTGIFVDATNTGSNPLIADTDGDGMNDALEVAAERDPNNYNYSQITVAGAFQGWSPPPTPTNAPVNVMTNVSGTQWELNFRFAAVTNAPGKFTIGDWAKNWGASTNPAVARLDGDNINFNVTASGIWKFSFNTASLAYSFTRQGTNGLTYAQWAAQYGLAANSEGGGGDITTGGDDFLTNLDEFLNNTDPLNGDTDGDGLFDDEEVVGSYEIYTTFNGTTLNPTSPDSDGDGLRDGWELQYSLVPTDDGSAVSYSNYTGLSVPATGANPNGGGGDPDGDGVTNLQEQQAGTNPLAAGTGFASVHPKITVPGSFNGWNAAGSPANTMQLVGNFTWNLVVYFASVPVSPNFKFAAGGWATNWGDIAPADGIADSGTDTNISGANTFTAPGYYLITFNDSTRAYSLGALPTADADSDGLPDVWEAYHGGFLNPKITDLNPATAYVAGSTTTAAQAFAAGVSPVRDETPPVITLNGVPLSSLVLNGNYTDAGASATDDLDTTVTVNATGSVNPAVVGTYTITYSASDTAGNAATPLTRTVVVYDPAVGFASRLTSVTVPGSHTSWDVTGATGNSMTLVGNFKWKLLYTFSAPASIQYKVVGNGATSGWDSPSKWGSGGVLGAGDASANVVAGVYAFELDELLNTASLTLVSATSTTSFSSWSGNAPVTSELAGKYGIGGASGPSATDGVAPTSTFSGGNLVLTAIVRTDDAKLTVVGEAAASLGDFATLASLTPVNGVDAADQTGVPAGHKRRTFTVAQGMDSRKFLRLKATLAP